MIRYGDHDNLDEVLALCDRFNAKYYPVPLDHGKFVKWYNFVVDNGVVILSDTGVIAGFHQDDPVRDWSILAENVWYAEDRSGVALLDEFIDYGHELGVDEIRMTTLSNSPVGAMRLLQHKGFEEIERSHRLIL